MGHLVEKYHKHDTPHEGYFDEGDIWECKCGDRFICRTGQFDTWHWEAMKNDNSR